MFDVYRFIITAVFLFGFLFLAGEKALGQDEIRKVVFVEANQPPGRQIRGKNTRYIIKDTIDLNGRVIRVPKNSVLVFSGGRFRNGIIKGGNTTISETNAQLFDETITLEGTWAKMSFRPEWFGAAGDGLADDTDALQRTLICASHVLLTGTYRVQHLSVGHSLSITGGCLKAFLDAYGNTRNVISAEGAFDLSFTGVDFDGSGSFLPKEGRLEPMIKVLGARSVLFDRCTVHNHSQNCDLDDEVEWEKRRCYAMSVLGADNVVIDSCVFHDNYSEQVAIGSNSDSQNRKPKTVLVVSNCSSYSNKHALALFLLFNLKSATIDSNSFEDNGRTFFNLLSSNVTISNNLLINTQSRAITSEANGAFYSADSITIVNNSIINAREGAISIGNSVIRIEDNTIRNDFLSGTNDYLVRLGGLYTGDNVVSDECHYALPYYDNSYIQNQQKGDIIITKNSISGFANRGAIAIRPTENVTDGKTDKFGAVINVSICDNTIKVFGSASALYLPNGSYSGITFGGNTVEMGSEAPMVYMSPSRALQLKRSLFEEMAITKNIVRYPSNAKVEFLVKMEYGDTREIDVSDNIINATIEKGMASFTIE